MKQITLNRALFQLAMEDAAWRAGCAELQRQLAAQLAPTTVTVDGSSGYLILKVLHWDEPITIPGYQVVWE